jgi:uncharacterized protein DUF4126
VDLFLAITQGLGLATAAGMRTFLAPLLVGALARADLGVDFEGTSYDFLEAPWFLALLLVLSLVAFALERSRADGGARLGVAGTLMLGAYLASGAVLFAASLAEAGETSWPGIPAGIAAALLAFVVVRGVLIGAHRRAGGSGELLDVYAAAAALALAGLSILAPPISILAVAGLLWLWVGQRRRAQEKYEGLRVLR